MIELWEVGGANFCSNLSPKKIFLFWYIDYYIWNNLKIFHNFINVCIASIYLFKSKLFISLNHCTMSLFNYCIPLYRTFSCNNADSIHQYIFCSIITLFNHLNTLTLSNWNNQNHSYIIVQLITSNHLKRYYSITNIIYYSLIDELFNKF